MLSLDASVGGHSHSPAFELPQVTSACPLGGFAVLLEITLSKVSVVSEY